MNFQSLQLSQAILLLVTQGGGKMTLLTQQIYNLPLSHRLLDIREELIKPTHTVSISIPRLNLIFCSNRNSAFLNPG